jgi:site-specific DNA-cytosine methylase
MFKKMRVLVACEFSGIVRDAFAKRGHDAWSCDLLPTEREGKHIQGDVLNISDEGWDLMIAHPPCTYLTVSGNKWMKPEFADRFPDRPQQRKDAIDFVMALANAPIEKICIENPIGVMSTQWRRPDQIIQPYFFGDPVPKSTCLWLKNLPKLLPTNMVEPEFIIGKRDGKKYSLIHYQTPNDPDRWKIRSRTFQGIANAMANQWS